jgi:hypothetical protein
MTLLIACLLMHHMGIADPWAYVGTCLLWMVHLVVQPSSSK